VGHKRSCLAEEVDPLGELTTQPAVLLLSLHQRLAEGHDLVEEASEPRHKVIGHSAQRLHVRGSPPSGRLHRRR
jgi:hypothetical protein